MEERTLLFLIGIANLIGFAYGIYYYSGQLAEWSPLFWILIIDCPLQAFLVGSLFISSSVGKTGGKLFELTAKFASAGSIKYGIWTMFIILFHSEYFLTGDGLETYALLFFAHLGLLIEGLVISSAYKMRLKETALICLLYLINDYSDYVIGTHPIIPNESIGIVAAFTVALTFVSVLVAKHCGDRKAVRIGFISRYLSS